MAAISKFLFEHEFGSVATDSGTPAPRPDTRRFTSTEMEAAKSAAFETGVSAGREAASKEISQRIEDILKVVVAALNQLMKDSAEHHAQRVRDSLGAVGEIMRKLMPAMAKRDALGEIEALVGDCLSRLHDEPRLVIRVNDGLLDPLKQRLEPLAAAAGFSGRLILLAEGALKETDARIEWADGGADRDFAVVWQDIDNAIQRYVKDGPGEPAAASV